MTTDNETREPMTDDEIIQAARKLRQDIYLNLEPVLDEGSPWAAPGEIWGQNPKHANPKAIAQMITFHEDIDQATAEWFAASVMVFDVYDKRVHELQAKLDSTDWGVVQKMLEAAREENTALRATILELKELRRTPQGFTPYQYDYAGVVPGSKVRNIIAALLKAIGQ
jgi:hypothetical protein